MVTNLALVCTFVLGIVCDGNNVGSRNLINWTVGDTANFDVTLGAIGKVGTMKKSVTKADDAQNAIWVRTEANLAVQKDTTDILMSRADGSILRFVRNGKEEAVPENDIEIISQEYTEITVPAGTFKAIHIVADTKDVKGIEVWANPRDTIMEGTLKQVVPSQFGKLEISLTSFKKGDSITIQPFPPICGDFVPCEDQPE